MKTFDEYLQEQLKDPEFKKEYDGLQAEYEVISSLIEARISQKITQKQLSEKSGITQADISRIENGSRNPSIRVLSRLADAMDMKLKIEFVPKEGY